MLYALIIFHRVQNNTNKEESFKNYFSGNDDESYQHQAYTLSFYRNYFSLEGNSNYYHSIDLLLDIILYLPTYKQMV